jgi:predicted small metal-binding protein
MPPGASVSPASGSGSGSDCRAERSLPAGAGQPVAIFPRYHCPCEGDRKETAMKEFHCGTLVPGCEWHTRAEEEAEVMRRAVEHMRETHGETIIRETMIEAIRSRISKVRDAA